MSEEKQESGHSQAPVGQALSRALHIGIPIASILVLLAFAVVLFLPADKGTLPVESTAIFIPVYLTIVIVLVLGSMYLFKRLMDTEYPPAVAH
jgi:flagellar biosynthesis protein FliQ